MGICGKEIRVCERLAGMAYLGEGTGSWKVRRGAQTSFEGRRDRFNQIH